MLSTQQGISIADKQPQADPDSDAEAKNALVKIWCLIINCMIYQLSQWMD